MLVWQELWGKSKKRNWMNLRNIWRNEDLNKKPRTHHSSVMPRHSTGDGQNSAPPVGYRILSLDTVSCLPHLRHMTWVAWRHQKRCFRCFRLLTTQTAWRETLDTLPRLVQVTVTARSLQVRSGPRKHHIKNVELKKHHEKSYNSNMNCCVSSNWRFGRWFLFFLLTGVTFSSSRSIPPKTLIADSTGNGSSSSVSPKNKNHPMDFSKRCQYLEETNCGFICVVFSFLKWCGFCTDSVETTQMKMWPLKLQDRRARAHSVGMFSQRFSQTRQLVLELGSRGWQKSLVTSRHFLT